MRFKTLAAVFILFFGFCQISQAQTTGFTYQGNLNSSGAPANGNFDFQAALFDAATGGNSLCVSAQPNLTVVNGLFSLQIDCGANFPGANRFLEIRVRPNGGNTFTILTPRQPVLSSPYAITSINALTAANSISLGGIPSSGFILNSTFQQSASNFNISGNGTVGNDMFVTNRLSAGIVDAATQFNFLGNRLLTAANTSIFAGIGAGLTNSPRQNNAFFGFNSGLISSGSENSFFGSRSGESTTSGTLNSFFGYQSGTGNTTGTFNTALGTGAGFDTGNLTNASAVGTQAVVAQSNSLVLGSIAGLNGAVSNVNVGIGTIRPRKRLHIYGPGDQEIMIESSDTNGNQWTLQSSDGASNGRFEIIDRTANLSRLTILNNGNVGVGTTTPDFKLDVNGSIAVGTLGTGGTIALCRTPTTGQLALCSSSIRYKTNISAFTPGVDLVRKLRPVSFNWKADGKADLGLVAEDVAAVEPLLTTTNEKGEVEGVKYDRVGVVLVNAVQEQQKQIDELNETIKRQTAEIAALKQIVCAQNPSAALCKEER